MGSIAWGRLVKVSISVYMRSRCWGLCLRMTLIVEWDIFEKLRKIQRTERRWLESFGCADGRDLETVPIDGLNRGGLILF